MGAAFTWPSEEYKLGNLHLSTICFTLKRSLGRWPISCATQRFLFPLAISAVPTPKGNQVCAYTQLLAWTPCPRHRAACPEQSSSIQVQELLLKAAWQNPWISSAVLLVTIPFSPFHLHPPHNNSHLPQQGTSADAAYDTERGMLQPPQNHRTP